MGSKSPCDLSLHQKFQSPSITPSIKLFMASNNKNKNKNKKVTENSGNFVPPLLRKGDESFSLRAQGKLVPINIRKYLNAMCQLDKCLQSERVPRMSEYLLFTIRKRSNII